MERKCHHPEADSTEDHVPNKRSRFDPSIHPQHNLFLEPTIIVDPYDEEDPDEEIVEDPEEEIEEDPEEEIEKDVEEGPELSVGSCGYKEEPEMEEDGLERAGDPCGSPFFDPEEEPHEELEDPLDYYDRLDVDIPTCRMPISTFKTFGQTYRSFAEVDHKKDEDPSGVSDAESRFPSAEGCTITPDSCVRRFRSRKPRMSVLPIVTVWL